MAKYEIRFFDDVEPYRFVTAKIQAKNIVSISIEDAKYPSNIFLDKSTAIKFAKALRTEINKMEASNG